MLTIIISLSSIIKFTDQLRKVGKGCYTISNAINYTLLSIPKDISEFFSFILLPSTLLGLNNLIQHNEFMAMQILGFTRSKIVKSILKTSVIVTFFAISIDEFLVPQSEKLAKNYRANRILGKHLLSTKNGIWLKDKNNFVFIKNIFNDHYFSEMSIYELNNDHKLVSMLYANNAKYNDNYNCWYLFQVKKIDLINSRQILSNKVIWKSILTPDKIKLISLDSDTLSIPNLLKYISYLRVNGQKTEQYKLSLWNKIFLPVSITIIMLTALFCTLVSLCNYSTAKLIIFSSLFSFSILIIGNILKLTVLLYSFSPLIVSLSPNFLLIILISFFIKKDKFITEI